MTGSRKPNNDEPWLKCMEPDQRQVQRNQIRQSAIVSALGTATPVIHGEILNLGEGGTQIWLDQPLRYATLVRIDYNDNLLLGEVVYCQPEQAGWLVGIRVEHALLGVTTLTRAMGAH
jgi:hypothetical protein